APSSNGSKRASNRRLPLAARIRISVPEPASPTTTLLPGPNGPPSAWTTPRVVALRFLGLPLEVTVSVRPPLGSSSGVCRPRAIAPGLHASTATSGPSQSLHPAAVESQVSAPSWVEHQGCWKRFCRPGDAG